MSDVEGTVTIDLQAFMALKYDAEKFREMKIRFSTRRFEVSEGYDGRPTSNLKPHEIYELLIDLSRYLK